MSDEKPGREDDPRDAELTDEQLDREAPGVDDAAELEAAEDEIAAEAEAEEDKVVATPARAAGGRITADDDDGRRRAGVHPRRAARPPVPPAARARAPGPAPPPSGPAPTSAAQKRSLGPVPARGRRRAAQGHLAGPPRADHLHDRGHRLRGVHRRAGGRPGPALRPGRDRRLRLTSARACTPPDKEETPVTDPREPFETDSAVEGRTATDLDDARFEQRGTVDLETGAGETGAAEGSSDTADLRHRPTRGRRRDARGRGRRPRQPGRATRSPRPPTDART